MAVWMYYGKLRERIRMPRLNGETTTKFLPFRNSIVYLLEPTSTTRYRSRDEFAAVYHTRSTPGRFAR